MLHVHQFMTVADDALDENHLVTNYIEPTGVEMPLQIAL